MIKNKSQLVYVIKVSQRDKNTKEEEIKMYPIFDIIFDSKEELEKYLINGLEKENKELITYDIHISYAIKYRKLIEAEKKETDLITIDRKEVKDLIKAFKEKHNGWNVEAEKDMVYALFNLLDINLKDIF